MSVFRRKTTKGLTREYHYRFNRGGKMYSAFARDAQMNLKLRHLRKKSMTALMYLPHRSL